ncbi:2-methylcitrate dehydratase [Tilletiopsis washingtonensis]|uniref:2-methylcitrate dehydratase n=1 Tax=Tilletiopsis washingtonensis TaxID=58919 RepID=A0A316ZF36_9BASI|nr:2-methylcitrate dehydratase [Tilletiopsis washingtonensis]PWO00378.1 2-methylcitrate dehydratase [Tilletiopsis washingtonensis]
MGGGIGLGEDNVRPPYDQVLQDIADYVHSYEIKSDTAFQTARLCLMDSLGCHMEALRFPGARAVTGPVVEGTIVPNGAKVPGTNFQLDPIRAAFNNGALIRWLDFNDTWLAAEWGHPSDNLGSILAVADWLSRTAVANGQAPLTVRDILEAAIKAHEIQGNLAIENSFNRVGLDHVVLVKVASAAVVSKMLGNTRDQTVDVVSQAFVDGQSLRTYRHAPNAGSRKSWAAGDACSRAVNLALLVKKGEMGYPSVLTAKTWGFYDVLFKGKEFKFQRPYTSYVMENVLFKLVPAEFHSQTAVEAAVILHKKMQEAGKTSDDIKKVTIRTQEAAIRIISKQGKLNNYADRDHCIQYMVAVPLIHGKLEPQMYNDDFAEDPRIDELRGKIYCEEDARYTKEYMEADKRSIGNGVLIEFNDGSKLDEVAMDYPVGHARRREESIPLIKAKLAKHLDGHFDQATQSKLVNLIEDTESFDKMPANEFIDLWLKK